MPNNVDTDIEKLSPEKLLTQFSRSGIVLCIILAFGLHVIVLGGTSVDYIHGIVDPAWQEEQDRLKVETRRKAEAERRAREGAVVTATTAPATRPTSRPAARPKPPAEGRKLPAEVTTMPKSGEVPKLPGSGIGIDETEGR
jgi:hypothetical protein